MSPRATQPSVRNPVVHLPAAALLKCLPSVDRQAMRALLNQLSQQCRDNANKSWRTHKAPMAAYWKACAVYARHIALLLR